MRRLLCVLLLVASTARAEDPASVSVIVPVVASTIGPFDTHWKTDIVLHNDLKTEATVALSMPTAKDQPIILLTIPGGGTQRFTDVVGEAFAMDDVLSPLVVQTLGRRSVQVIATAYAIQGEKITPAQPIPITDASSFYSLRTLPSIAYSEDRRTNIGLVNLGDTEAVMTVALRSGSGETLAATRSVIPPNSMWHMAVQLMFPAMAMGEDYAVLVETGSHNTYIYASVLDNKTNEARFIGPLVGAR